MKIRTGIALALGLAVAVVTVPLGARLYSSLGGNLPWESEREESAGPALLHSLEDLAEYHAARGNYQVHVGIDETSPIAPSFLHGESADLLATGSVDATIDLSDLDDDAVRVRDDGSVLVTLPAPELAPAVVDPEQSEVVGREQGLLDRVAGVVADDEIPESDLYALAADELDAAALDSDLTSRAEANTRDMLEGLLAELGFDDATVRFSPPPDEAA